ncbi:MAG: hypothetical protein AB7S75_16665 [Desulfococcaceae bacterium]
MLRSLSKNQAVILFDRHSGKSRNPVLSGVPDTVFRRYDDPA